MFPVARPKLALRDEVYYFYYLQKKKTPSTRNLFINRTGKKYTPQNNTIGRGRGLSFLISVSQISQKQTQIFDFPHKHN